MSLSEQKKLTKRRFSLESIAILLILMSPFLWKVHQYFPETEEPVSFLWFEIGANGFLAVSTHVWVLISKIIPLYLLTLWFFTCKHWWYHILLIPICMYAFQIFEVVFALDSTIDVQNILWILPVCMVVIPFVYFIRLKLFDKYVHGIDMEAMAAELEYYKSKEQAELDSIGVNVDRLTAEKVQEDLSNKTPRRTINQLMSQLQQGMRSLLSL